MGMNEYQIPHDSELEEYVIGCMLYDPACIADIADEIKPAYFYHAAHSKLCARILELWMEDEKQVDLVNLAPTLQKVNISVGRMADVISSIPTVANVAHYAERLRDLAALRSAVKVGRELMSAGELRDTDEIREAITTAEGKLSQIGESTVKIETMSTMKEALMAYNEDFEKTYYSDTTGITGVKTGFPDLDRMTAGLQKTELIILAARPSVGKTALSLQIARNVSMEEEQPVAFFSLEMATKKLIPRLIASEAMIDLQKLNTGLIDENDMTKYMLAVGKLGTAQMIIDDDPSQTVQSIKAKSRRIQRQLGGLGLIVIDYLQLIQGARGLNRYELVSENTRQLKIMARELDVPVIALSQLSRGVEQRADKRPKMSDLRESGSIEQDADIVAFLHRDDYYDQESAKKNIAEIILAKQRNGPTGTVELAFLKSYNRFASLKQDQPEQVTAEL